RIQSISNLPRYSLPPDLALSGTSGLVRIHPNSNAAGLQNSSPSSSSHTPAHTCPHVIAPRTELDMTKDGCHRSSLKPSAVSRLTRDLTRVQLDVARKERN